MEVSQFQIKNNNETISRTFIHSNSALTLLSFRDAIQDCLRHLLQFLGSLFSQVFNDFLVFRTAMINVFHAADRLANVFFRKLGQRFIIATTLVNLQTRASPRNILRMLVSCFRQTGEVITELIRYEPREPEDHLDKERQKKT